MSASIVPVSAGAQAGGLSFPHYCTFCVSDEGSGGSVFINGLGVGTGSVSNAYDLATIFTSQSFTWRSIPLLRAFRSAPSLNDAADQFKQWLDVKFLRMDGTPADEGLPFISYLHGLGGGPADVPYLGIATPPVDGIWRVDLRLRHTITN